MADSQQNIEVATADSRPSASRPGRRNGLLAYVAWGLVLLILAFEVFVMFWLPKEMEYHEAFGVEIARQRTVSLIDGLVGRARTWEFEEGSSSREALTVVLVKGELDRIKQYLREHENKLSWQQIDDIYEDLSMFQKLLDELAGKVLYSETVILELDEPLRYMLE